MMNRILYKIGIVFFASVLSVNAQQKLQKISKSIDVNKDVTIDLNTSFANIEFETWNKNVIEVEAFIESDKLSKDDLQKALKAWTIHVEGYGDEVSISTKGGSSSWAWMSDLGQLESLEGLEDLGSLFSEMPAIPELPEFPELPEVPEVPELPEGLLSSLGDMNFPEMLNLPEGVTSVSFDTDEYEERGEAYLDEWSKNFDKKYGPGYKEKMKAWAREFVNSDFESKMEAWGEEFGEKFGKEMEAWGENFGETWGKDFEKKMEKWGESFGEKWGDEYAKKMEAWGESLDEKLSEKYGDDYEVELQKRAKRMKERARKRSSIFDNESNSKVKKTIKIKMPKDAKLKVNVRHGELKFASVTNLKADLSHSKLVANSIDGSSTSINASYTDVKVNNWLQGDLKLNYVDDAKLIQVGSLVLSSNSSNINIGSLSQRAIIDGSFGDLMIGKIENDFSSLNIILENSEAMIKLPNSDYDLLFKGSRSKFNNESVNKKAIKNYPEGSNSNKTIVVNAKFSNVIMQ